MGLKTKIAVLLVAVGAASVASAQSPTSAQRVQDALENCFQCHGPGGVSIIPSRPTIAGQNAEYIKLQLEAFKNAAKRPVADTDGDADDGAKALATGEEQPTRIDPVMEHMVAGLPDDLVAPVAEAVSKLACDGGKAKKPRSRLSAIPAAAKPCVMCHGHDGIGAQAYIPNIAGQQRAYLRRQLLLIRETAWGAMPREGEAWRAHPIMEAQAARLKITDVDAIARYYSGLDCRGAASAE